MATAEASDPLEQPHPSRKLTQLAQLCALAVVWRVAAERWRNPRRRHTLVMKNVAGLHNRMFAE
jgi:hypothetical protein